MRLVALGTTGRTARLLLLALGTLLAAEESPRAAGGFPSREEVLKSVYPGATHSAERIFLTEVEVKRIEELSGTDLVSPLLALYRINRGVVLVGRAYVDTHVVRSKRESLLVCLDAGGKVKRVEVTAFLEPPEYSLSERWYRQFEDRSLEPHSRVGQSIRPVAGATLTSRAAADAVRRVLAIDKVVTERK